MVVEGNKGDGAGRSMGILVMGEVGEVGGMGGGMVCLLGGILFVYLNHDAFEHLLH